MRCFPWRISSQARRHFSSLMKSKALIILLFEQCRQILTTGIHSPPRPAAGCAYRRCRAYWRAFFKSALRRQDRFVPAASSSLDACRHVSTLRTGHQCLDVGAVVGVLHGQRHNRIVNAAAQPKCLALPVGYHAHPLHGAVSSSAQPARFGAYFDQPIDLPDRSGSAAARPWAQTHRKASVCCQSNSSSDRADGHLQAAASSALCVGKQSVPADRNTGLGNGTTEQKPLFGKGGQAFSHAAGLSSCQQAKTGVGSGRRIGEKQRMTRKAAFCHAITQLLHPAKQPRRSLRARRFPNL